MAEKQILQILKIHAPVLKWRQGPFLVFTITRLVRAIIPFNKRQIKTGRKKSISLHFRPYNVYAYCFGCKKQ